MLHETLKPLVFVLRIANNERKLECRFRDCSRGADRIELEASAKQMARGQRRPVPATEKEYSTAFLCQLLLTVRFRSSAAVSGSIY